MGKVVPLSSQRQQPSVFRMYPLWAAVVAAVLAFSLVGIAEVRDFGQHSVAAVAVAHVTLLQEAICPRGILPTPASDCAEGRVKILAGLAAVSVMAGVTLPPSALSDRAVPAG
ncbi:hypothetical protein QF030_000839 [Streptomyces rishiriensis]|uniref:Uncharacterized protein n=1 Tax=Streptomyces rishiriensis TaxID=68264 RepID=A0ABU0NHQ6_STRRH|nr:hypothetical protein [Streptomyces rishiriensis]